jgi:hypothetical protein
MATVTVAPRRTRSPAENDCLAVMSIRLHSGRAEIRSGSSLLSSRSRWTRPGQRIHCQVEVSRVDLP